MKNKILFLAIFISAVIAPISAFSHGNGTGHEHQKAIDDKPQNSKEDIAKELCEVPQIEEDYEFEELEIKDINELGITEQTFPENSPEAAVKDFFTIFWSDQDYTNLVTPRKMMTGQYMIEWLRTWRKCLPMEIGGVIDEGKSAHEGYLQKKIAITTLCGKKKVPIVTAITVSEIDGKWFIDDDDFSYGVR